MNDKEVRHRTRHFVIELIIFILIIGFLVSIWAIYDEPDKQSMEFYKKHEERGLAASAIKDTISASLTATSVILAATALIISLSKSAVKINDAVKIHYKYVAYYTYSWKSIFLIEITGNN